MCSGETTWKKGKFQFCSSGCKEARMNAFIGFSTKVDISELRTNRIRFFSLRMDIRFMRNIVELLLLKSLNEHCNSDFFHWWWFVSCCPANVFVLQWMWRKIQYLVTLQNCNSINVEYFIICHFHCVRHLHIFESCQLELRAASPSFGQKRKKQFVFHVLITLSVASCVWSRV